MTADPHLAPRPAIWLGDWIRRSLRCSLSVHFVPWRLKFLWLRLCFAVLKRKFMRQYAPDLTSIYGFKLQGSVADSTLNRVIFYKGLFEPSLSEIVARYVRAGDLCMDVGANTGYFTLLMANIVGDRGKVVAVEASPGNANHLLRNLELNRLSHRVEVHPVACGSASGSTVFWVNKKNDMHSRLVPPSKGSLVDWLLGKRWLPVEVKVATLSEIIGDRAHDVVFLKIDIEGAEHLIAPSVVANFTNPELMVAIEAKQPRVMETLKPFEKAGFVAYDLRNNYRWLVENKHEPAIRATFEELFARRGMVDVLLSRRALDCTTRSSSTRPDVSFRATAGLR